MSARDQVGRCRFCGYLYYTWKLPVHESICSMRPADSGPPLSFLPEEHTLTLTESHSSVTIC